MASILAAPLEGTVPLEVLEGDPDGAPLLHVEYLINHPPTAFDDSVSALEDTLVVIPAAANDVPPSDPETCSTRNSQVVLAPGWNR